MKVLILEDDEHTQRLLRSIADTEGWSVEYGASFDEVHRHLAWCDVLVLDMHLPGVSGVEVLDHLRGLERRPAVVVVTADESLRAAAQARGARAFLVKPFEVPDLVAAIRHVGGPLVDLTTAEVRVARSRR